MERRSEISRRSLSVLIGCLVCQTGAGLFYATRTLAPDVIAELGWTRAMWSSAMAPMIFVSSLSQAFVGAACVRFGVRPVIGVAVLLLGATFVLLAHMQTVWHFHLAMMLLALGTAGIGDVSIGAVVTRWFERARGLALGIAMVGSNVGAVVFVHVIAMLSETLNWREAALRVGLGSAALILPIALLVIREPRRGEGAQGDVGRGGGAVPLQAREAVRAPAFWLLFFVLFTYALAQLGIADHLILYLMDLGYSKLEAAGALELAIGAGIASKLGAGAIALRLRPKTALAINTAILAGSFALIPFAADPVVLSCFGVMFGISTAARDVLFPLLVAEVFGARFFAQIYGVVMLAYFPGGGLGPVALGLVYDWIGSYRAAFAGVAVLLALACVSVVRLPLPARQAELRAPPQRS